MTEAGDGTTKARVTVSLDPDVAAWLKRSAADVGANVSEYVQDLAKARQARDEWVARWRALNGEPDPEMVAAARRQLLGHGAENSAQDVGPGDAPGVTEARRAS